MFYYINVADILNKFLQWKVMLKECINNAYRYYLENNQVHYRENIKIIPQKSLLYQNPVDEYIFRAWAISRMFDLPPLAFVVIIPFIAGRTSSLEYFILGNSLL